jgi:hypothetical protein
MDEEALVERIASARHHLAYAAPAITERIAKALIDAYGRESLSVTVILDADEDAYRIGFGDPAGLALLHEFAKSQQMPLRREPGLRIGLLAIDDAVYIWAPTARAVEGERRSGQANAIVLGGEIASHMRDAVGAEQSSVLPSDAQIGRDPIRPEETQRMVEALKENPPAPFDLSRKTRVFATKFQFIEWELQGAEWTERKIKLSSLLLNSDLPEELQDILETQIRPFQASSNLALEVPVLVRGQVAHSKTGEPILDPTTQAQMQASWKAVRDRYLRQVKGFGWLIRKSDLAAFHAEVRAYEEVLRAWVAKFREQMRKDEEGLVKNIVASIHARLQRSERKDKYKAIDLKAEVENGLKRMRIIEPRVRIVPKEISWESTRDEEFTRAIREAIPVEELRGWFEIFEAARQRATTKTDLE